MMTLTAETQLKTNATSQWSLAFLDISNVTVNEQMDSQNQRMLHYIPYRYSHKSQAVLTAVINSVAQWL